MRGHVRKRGKKWAIIVDIGFDENGKRKQKWFSGYNTKKEAEKDIPEIISKIEKNQFINVKDITLSEFLEKWLKDYAKHNVVATTYSSYVDAVKHLTQGLGLIKLDKLRPDLIQSFISTKLETHSNRNVRYYYKILNCALNTAIKWQIISFNPCAAVTPPKVPKKSIEILDALEVNVLLDAAKETVIYMPILLAITCGMRRGEILGLKWNHIDFENNILHIRDNLVRTYTGEVLTQNPKTETGKRSITVPTETIKALRQHRKYQLKIKSMLHHQYQDGNYVCCWEDGRHFHPDYVTSAFKKLIRKLELTDIRFHDLRHTHASLLLADGVNVKVIQERLGHSNISITLDTYSHVLPNLQKEAANKIDSLLKSFK